MIIMASGRCDICAFYTPWLMERMKAGYVDVRNPFNEHQISRIMLDEEHIDLLTFCTKNPIPILPYLNEIPFEMLFHITITGYHKDMETNVYDKSKIIDAVKQLSKRLGKERVILRYDPIIITKRYTIAYHEKALDSLLSQLSESIDSCIISFVDLYKNTRKNKIKSCSEEEMKQIGEVFGKLSKKYEIPIQTCAESIDLSEYGIKQGLCFDYNKITELLGYEPAVSKKGVRNQCACIESVDIGDYNCCYHGCQYCYANYDEKQLQNHYCKHDIHSSLLIGNLSEQDKIHVRKGKKKIIQFKM